jgi:amino acid permease
MGHSEEISLKKENFFCRPAYIIPFTWVFGSVYFLKVVPIFVFIFTIGHFVLQGGLPPSCARPAVVWESPELSMLKVVPIFVFSFTCHQNIFLVHNELPNSSSRYL